MLVGVSEFQLILNPIRDWNLTQELPEPQSIAFQLILNPIRDWNNANGMLAIVHDGSN